MSDAPSTVESVSEQIGRLVAERQRLRAENAPADELERNRLAIAEAQQVLSELLIQRHRPSAAA
jgi:Tfp pilus assembly protein PilN